MGNDSQIRRGHWEEFGQRIISKHWHHQSYLRAFLFLTKSCLLPRLHLERVGSPASFDRWQNQALRTKTQVLGLGPSSIHSHWLLAGGALHRWGEDPHAQLLSCVRLSAASWAVAHRAPLYAGLSRREYCCGLPFPPPGDLPKPGIKPESTASPALEGAFFITVLPGKPQRTHRPIRSHIHEVKSRAFVVKWTLIQIPAAALQQSLSFCTWVSYIWFTGRRSTGIGKFM